MLLGREQEGCRDIFNTLHGNMEASTWMKKIVSETSSLRGSLLVPVLNVSWTDLRAHDVPRLGAGTQELLVGNSKDME